MTEEADYVSAKRTSRVYLSKEFPKQANGVERPARYISRVLASGERAGLATVKKEVVLRVTTTGREQVKALFYIDDRQIDTLLFQRFTAGPDKPHESTAISLRGDEIRKVVELLQLIDRGRIEGHDKFRIEESDLDEFRLSEDAIRSVVRSHPKLINELARRDVTEQDIVAVAYRKKILERFRKMLDEREFFDSEKKRLSKQRPEDVWQALFEENTWIFGYGLLYIFASPLDNRKLEQVVAGTSIAGPGKRADALLRTRGRISSLCFVEIKTHLTPLLDAGQAYRAEAWAASRALSGAIAQAHRTVQKAEQEIGTRLEIKDERGVPTGERAFLFRPRSLVVIGNLDEFVSPNGVNESMFSSFELLRRQTSSPEIITFDELYERARFIVETSDAS